MRLEVGRGAPQPPTLPRSSGYLTGEVSPTEYHGGGGCSSHSEPEPALLMGTLGQHESAEAVGPPPSCFPFLYFLSSFFVCLSVSFPAFSLSLYVSVCLCLYVSLFLCFLSESLPLIFSLCLCLSESLCLFVSLSLCLSLSLLSV